MTRVKGVLVTGAALLLASLVVGAGPAGAAPPDRYSDTGFEAFAQWSRYVAPSETETESYAAVFVSGREGAVREQAGRALPYERVTVDVEQWFCDTAADQFVVRWASGDAPADLTVDRKLGSASWQPVAVTVSGLQFRYAGTCSAPGTDDTADVSEFSAGVTVGATMTATSTTVRESGVSNGSDEWGRYHSQYKASYRYATAEVSFTTTAAELAFLDEVEQPLEGAIAQFRTSGHWKS